MKIEICYLTFSDQHQQKIIVVLMSRVGYNDLTKITNCMINLNNKMIISRQTQYIRTYIEY